MRKHPEPYQPAADSLDFDKQDRLLFLIPQITGEKKRAEARFSYCREGCKDYLRSFSGGTSRTAEPTNSWRGRPIFCSGSAIISFHWAIQPMVRAMAKIPVNRDTGMPRADCTMPE